MNFMLVVAILYFFCISSASSSEDTDWFKNPNMAAFSSLIVPGSVQLHDERYQMGSAFLGTAIGAQLLLEDYMDADDFIEDDDRFDDDLKENYINLSTFKADVIANIKLNNALLSSYDAYKSRKHDGAISPKDHISDLWSAPFEWNFISRPTTYVPMLVIAIYASQRDNNYAFIKSSDVSGSDLHISNALKAEVTAVGEEAFFRGYVNTEMSDNYGENYGLLGSSLIFGATHTGEGDQANFLEASSIGGYLGWLHQRNDYRLGESVAVHYWINFILGVAEIEQGGTIPLLEFNSKF
ncbi:MAG: CPBP family intramembrane glutamic endopeptidase [Gammaproteobacteria bacterium]